MVCEDCDNLIEQCDCLPRDHIAECSATASRPLPFATDHGCGLGRECWCEEGREIAACEHRKNAAGVLGTDSARLPPKVPDGSNP